MLGHPANLDGERSHVSDLAWRCSPESHRVAGREWSAPPCCRMPTHPSHVATKYGRRLYGLRSRAWLTGPGCEGFDVGGIGAASMMAPSTRLRQDCPRPPHCSDGRPPREPCLHRALAVHNQLFASHSAVHRWRRLAPCSWRRRDEDGHFRLLGRFALCMRTAVRALGNSGVLWLDLEWLWNRDDKGTAPEQRALSTLCLNTSGNRPPSTCVAVRR